MLFYLSVIFSWKICHGVFLCIIGIT